MIFNAFEIIITIILICIGLFIIVFRGRLIDGLSETLSVIIMRHQYNKRPKRIILIRHGESEANVNPQIYNSIPDSKISLTENGKEMARKIGEKLKELIKNESIQFYISPYKRTKETFEIIKSYLKENDSFEEYEPLLREQEYGNFHFFEETTFKRVEEFGKFYYRFNNGENCADVYIRAILFNDFMFRKIRSIDYIKRDNIIIICHDLFMRVFMMHFLNLDIDDFEEIRKPYNCEMWILQKHEDGHYYNTTDIFRKN